MNRPNSAVLLNYSGANSRADSVSHQNSQQRIKLIQSKAPAALHSSEATMRLHERRFSSNGPKTLLTQEKPSMLRRRAESDSPVLQAEATNDNVYMSSSDDCIQQDQNMLEERLSRGLRERASPLRRSNSLKSTRSRKSAKSNRAQTIGTRTSRSRSPRGSKNAPVGRKHCASFSKRKSSMTTLSNGGNLSLVPPNKDCKTSTNIIIKGAFQTIKGKPSSKKNLLGKKALSQSKRDADLMEKLLSEITAKYKTNLCKDQGYLQRLEKKTMIQEIQMLAQALISCDKAQKKQNENN